MCDLHLQCPPELLAPLVNMSKTGYEKNVFALYPLGLSLKWCGQNNLELNALKIVEMVVDFRRNPAPLTPITLSDSPVDTAESFRFLGTIISQDLK